jgi:hypothetical protein
MVGVEDEFGSGFDGGFIGGGFSGEGIEGDVSRPLTVGCRRREIEMEWINSNPDVEYVVLVVRVGDDFIDK